jgi:hypothetical protein
MDDHTRQRRLHDQHSREEAVLRQAQQHSAGGSHQPAQALPPHGEPPASAQSSAALQQDYEAAQRSEQAAWSRVTGLPGEAGFDADAWEAWRDTVEARDRATRLLINLSLGGMDAPGAGSEP